jgi:hypothetical protein
VVERPSNGNGEEEAKDSGARIQELGITLQASACEDLESALTPDFFASSRSLARALLARES